MAEQRLNIIFSGDATQLDKTITGITGRVEQLNTTVKKTTFAPMAASAKFAGQAILDAKEKVETLTAKLYLLNQQGLKSSIGKSLAADLLLAKKELKTLEVQAGISGTATSNALTKAFSGLRSLAFILPGIGIAGILGAVTSGISSLFDSIGKASNVLKESVSKAIGSSGEEIFKINALVAVLKNSESSLLQQKNARAILNKEWGISLGLLTKENINSVLTKKAVDDLTDSIYKKALAEAFAVKSAEKQIELFEKQQALTKAQKPIGFAGGFGTGGAAFGQLFNTTRLKSQIEEIQKSIVQIGVAGQNAIAESINRNLTKAKTAEQLQSAFEKAQSELQKLRDKLKKEKVQVPIKFNFVFEDDPNDPKSALKKITDFFKGQDIGKKLLPDLGPIKTDTALFPKLVDEEQITKQAKAITDVLTPAFDGFIDAVLAGKAPMKAFFDGIIQSISQVIKKLIAAAIQALILSALTQGTSSAGSFGSFFIKALGFGQVASPTRFGGGSIASGGGVLTTFVRGTDLAFVLNQAQNSIGRVR